MDVPTLILLGAAGGLLRGVLDVYTRFVSWQADRRAYRQAAAAGAYHGELPRFQVYFDPSVDVAAAVVHGVMGAGAAVLFGTTDQISGEYAALVVGMSAPMLLTQLGRIQTVNEAVTGGAQAAEAASGSPAPESVGSAATVPAPAASAPPAPAQASPAAPANDPARPLPDTGAPPPVPRPLDVPGPPAPFGPLTPPAGAPEPASAASLELPPEQRRLPRPAPPHDPPRAGTEGRDAPPWRARPAAGEEGL
ncbi:hypothetical protein [Streptomyces sp. NPDC047123]|uniref:hypothetical protein n=1 Tax=Streptomyces sp. NPDC047123 TaxID=3155622 RepID=UPI0033F8D8EE